jgi:hypothetical protein
MFSLRQQQMQAIANEKVDIEEKYSSLQVRVCVPTLPAGADCPANHQEEKVGKTKNLQKIFHMQKAAEAELNDLKRVRTPECCHNCKGAATTDGRTVGHC